MGHQRFNSIQVLRGLAAMMVLLAHIPLATNLASDPVAKDFPWRIGAMGVDVFFVISGFVIAMVTERSRGGPADFMRNRLTRILPMYLITSLLLYPLGPSSPGKVWNTLFFIPILDGQTYTNPAHWFGWSVAIEMWFYLVFATVLLFARDKVVRTYVSLMLSIVALTFFYNGNWLTPHFLGTPLALEFVLGVLLYQWRHKLGFRVSVMMIIIGACLMWYAGSARPWLALHEESIRSSQVAMLRASTWGLSSFMVVAGCVGLDLATKLRWPASLVWMGDISYSFYLTQPFAMLVARIVHPQSWWSTCLLLFSVTTLLAALANRFIEVPATRALRAGRVNRTVAEQA